MEASRGDGIGRGGSRGHAPDFSRGGQANVLKGGLESDVAARGQTLPSPPHGNRRGRNIEEGCDGLGAAESVDNFVGGAKNVHTPLYSRGVKIATTNGMWMAKMVGASDIPARKTSRPKANAVPGSAEVKEIGQRLFLLRSSQGYGGERQAAAFCRLIDVQPTAWHNYENGNRRISLDEAMKVALGTGATLEWIYRGDAWAWTLPGKLSADIREAKAKIEAAKKPPLVDKQPKKRS